MVGWPAWSAWSAWPWSAWWAWSGVVDVPGVGVVLGWPVAGLVVVLGPTPTERVAPFGAEPEPTVAGCVPVECGPVGSGQWEAAWAPTLAAA